MAADATTGTDLTAGVPEALAGGGADAVPGISPWRLAGRRLLRNKVALAFGGLFLVIVVLCLLAPVYAHHIAHTGPNDNNITAKVDGKDVVSPSGIPTGPTWHGRYFLGADSNGRDYAVRLLYGGRNSLEIGVLAVIITSLLGVAAALIAGYFRSWPDSIISRILDILWSFPAVLLGIALGVALAVDGINLGVVKLQGGSLIVPAFVIGVVYAPYLAKPLRGQVLGLREREFVDAARAQGLGPWRIMLGEVLPNLASSIIVFIPLLLANAILLEAGLSFLGAGVQDPNASWGTMIGGGIRLLPGAIHLTLVPGIMLMLTVLGVNVFGDGLRDALDPRAKVRIER